jgi:hypothetical protein
MIHLKARLNFHGAWNVCRISLRKIRRIGYENRALVSNSNTIGIEPVSSDFQINLLDQNYPNPFNPKTIINYGFKLRVTSV